MPSPETRPAKSSYGMMYNERQAYRRNQKNCRIAAFVGGSSLGHHDRIVQARIAKSREVLQRRLVAKRREGDAKVTALRESLATDEFGDVNPFTGLSTFEPLEELLDRKIAKFQRQALRSPDHNAETGYDLVHYDVEHADGTHSTVMAYLERASLTSTRAVGAPDDRVAHVIVISNSSEKSRYAFYKAGSLVEHTDLGLSEAQALVSQRLNAGIPFLSVAR